MRCHEFIKQAVALIVATLLLLPVLDCAGQYYTVVGGIGSPMAYSGTPIHSIVIKSAGLPSIYNPIYYGSPESIGIGDEFTTVQPILTNTPPTGCWCVDNIFVTNTISGFSAFAGWCGNMVNPSFTPGTGTTNYICAGRPAFVGLGITNQLANLLIFYAPTNAGASTYWTTNPVVWLYWSPQPGISNVLVASNIWPASVIGQPTFELSTNVNWVWFNNISAPGGEGIFSLRLTP